MTYSHRQFDSVARVTFVEYRRSDYFGSSVAFGCSMEFGNSVVFDSDRHASRFCPCLFLLRTAKSKHYD
jgi:hypothetical protein